MHRIHSDVHRVFQQAFHAEDIARPLLSFDDLTPAEEAKSAMHATGVDHAGVRTDGFVTAYIEAVDLRTGRCGEFARPFDETRIVAGASPLGELVLRLRDESRVFVTALGQVCGTIGRTDFLQPPARMWLFGMITLLELRFGRMIELNCPDDSWKGCLSEGRIRKAEAILEERARRGRRPNLLDCLQFSDKTQIIARVDWLRALTQFESKRQIEDVGRRLEMLRNALAHAQDIVTDDWDTIVLLAENLDDIARGRADENPPQ